MFWKYEANLLANIHAEKVAFKFIEITLWNGCCQVILLHISRALFHKNTYGGLLLVKLFEISGFLKICPSHPQLLKEGYGEETWQVYSLGQNQQFSKTHFPKWQPYYGYVNNKEREQISIIFGPPALVGILFSPKISKMGPK